MKHTPAALALVVLWAAVLAALAWFVRSEMAVSSDLRLFLPTPETPTERLLLEEIGEGPASRVLIATLGNAPAEQLAATSQALTGVLRGNAEFAWVANGELAFDSLPDELLPYRFLLSRTLDGQPLDASYLATVLEERVRDLSSPAGLVLEPLIPRDPTLETLTLLEQWQPAQGPRREFEVWFDAAGERALLLAATRAPAFDPAAQRAALEALEHAFATTERDPATTLTVTGTGNFSVLMEARTRAEVQWLGAAATAAMVIVVLLAYRSAGSVLLSALPLLTAGAAGLAAVTALFGAVHGITLAFGFTLIGVAQDYPLHLLSHRRADLTAREIARRIWPTLATGVASTCIAYLTFLFSGVLGLVQLACFTVAALAVAALVTRFLLPVLMATDGRDVGTSRALGRIWRATTGLPRARWAGAALLAGCAATIAFGRTPLWDNDLTNLTPVPADLVRRDQELRAELGAADTRFLMVVDASDEQEALRRLEALDPLLGSLAERGVIAGYDHAARYLPSAVAQRARQAKLPEPDVLRSALAAAASRTPFRPGVFEPFVADVARAATLAPLTIDALGATPLAATLATLLSSSVDGSRALVTFRGVRDAEALSAVAAAAPGIALLDLRAQSEALVERQRIRILASLGVAAVLLVGVVAVALRSRPRVTRVLAPLILTTFVVVAVLQAAGVPLNLFHLISLVLVAGLGLDYALFFEHAADDPAEQRRTLHAVLVCSLSTFVVFALLAMSSLPVLRAIGMPVAIGVASNFALALLLSRPDRERAAEG
jgi:predicted exporter